MLSEVNQSQKTNTVRPTSVRYLGQSCSRDRKQNGGCQGLGRGGNGKLVLMGTVFPFYEMMKRVLWMQLWQHNNVNILHAKHLTIIQMVKFLFPTCIARRIFTSWGYQRNRDPATSSSTTFFARLPFASHLSLWPFFVSFQKLLFSPLDHLQAIHKPDVVLGKGQHQCSGEAFQRASGFVQADGCCVCLMTACIARGLY